MKKKTLLFLVKGNFKANKEAVLLLIMFCSSLSIFAVVHPIFPSWEQRIGFASSVFLALNGLWTSWTLFIEKKIKAIQDIEDNFTKELKEIKNELAQEIESIHQEGQARDKDQDNKFEKLNETSLETKNKNQALEEKIKTLEEFHIATNEKFLEHKSRMDLLDLKLKNISKEYDTRQMIIDLAQGQEMSARELQQITAFLAKMGFKERKVIKGDETSHRE